MGGVFLNGFAQPADVNIQRARIPHVVGVPHLLDQRLARDHGIGVLQEKLGQPGQLGRQALFLLPDDQRTLGNIQPERPCLQNLAGAIPPVYEPPDAVDQLAPGQRMVQHNIRPPGVLPTVGRRADVDDRRVRQVSAQHPTDPVAGRAH